MKGALPLIRLVSWVMGCAALSCGESSTPKDEPAEESTETDASAESAAMDAAGEPATDETYNVDNLLPIPVISSTEGDPTNASPIPLSVDFQFVVSGGGGDRTVFWRDSQVQT